ncbi:Macrolide export protein MacA [Thalassocella blandensis]|nr:Macrolide export protein MacA [Thalassocella blandensis]
MHMQSKPHSSVTRWKRRILSIPGAIVLVIAIIFTTVYATQRESTTQENQPLLAVVERGNIENTVTATGSLQPSNSVEVGAQVSGQLEKLFVEVGDKVEQGQLLAQIDASVKAQQVEASQAALAALEAQRDSRQAAVKLAEANMHRQEQMLEQKATSQQEFDTAINTLVSSQSSLAQLEAQIQQSRASLASDQAELGYTKIYAPMAGTIVAISVKEGQTLNASQTAPTVLTIADLSIMTVETDVSEADIGKLTPGMKVYFTTLGSGNRRWYGSLEQILPTPEITNNVVLYTALFDVPNDDQVLRTSMTAQAFFITSSAQDVIRIPVASIRYQAPQRHSERPSRAFEKDNAPTNTEKQKTSRQGDPSITPTADMKNKRRRPTPDAYVTVVSASGKQQERQVELGISSRVYAEVISGLTEGEQIVAGISQASAGANKNDKNRPPRGFGGFR